MTATGSICGRLSSSAALRERTWRELQRGLLAGLGLAHVLHQAAVLARVALRGVADEQRAAGQLEQPSAQLQGPPVLLPARERRQVGVDVARQHLAVAGAHGGRRGLAGEPGHAWKRTERGGKKSVIRMPGSFQYRNQ